MWRTRAPPRRRSEAFSRPWGRGPSRRRPPPGGEACARCGGTFQDFRETGRLGCPDCYRSFEAPLRDLLRRLHGSTHHLGERYAEREPATAAAAAASTERAAALREQLRLAVETENFELAAELRDRLRVLE